MENECERKKRTSVKEREWVCVRERRKKNVTDAHSVSGAIS